MADCISKRFLTDRIVIARLVRRVVFHAAMLEAVVCAHGETAPSSLKVTAVRIWSLGDMTRVAVEVTSDFKFKASRLPDPERLFFDFREARPEPPIRGM